MVTAYCRDHLHGDNPMIDILVRLQNAMHEESAAHSPGTTVAIEAMRDAITEIERLRAAHEEAQQVINRQGADILTMHVEIERLHKLLRAVIPHIKNDIEGNAVLFKIGAALEPKP